MARIVQLSNARWFPPACRERRPDMLDRATTSLLARDAEFHASIWDMISGLDLADRIAAITCPTLIVAGSEDGNAPVSAGRVIADSLSGAVLEEMPGLGHFPPFEARVPLRRFLRSADAA
jgi:3-oxoadipate enol-lactonase